MKNPPDSEPRLLVALMAHLGITKVAAESVVSMVRDPSTVMPQEPREPYSGAHLDHLAGADESFLLPDGDLFGAGTVIVPDPAPARGSDEGDLDLTFGGETRDFNYDFPEDGESLSTGRAPLPTRYEELGVLGVGGMGEVLRVRDRSLNRILAMKVLHARLMDSPALVSRFVEEAQVQAQLQHPNIIPIHEIGALSDGRPYFTMKQAQEDAFLGRIQQVHRASTDTQWRPTKDGTTFRDLIRTFHQICVTMAYAHSQGVIHRDLKPENVLIGRFGEVLVVDWGLAKVLSGSSPSSMDELDRIETARSQADGHKTRFGSVAGTPIYMAPEQAHGHTERIGIHTDIYTLGAILYEVLSGRPPYQGGSVDEIIERVRTGDVLPPSLLGETGAENENIPPVDGEPSVRATGKIPSVLAELCHETMQREIGDRIESAELLAKRVKDWLEGAENRDKGLRAFQIAGQKLAQAEEHERNAAARWCEADQLLEREGPGSEEAWSLWQENQEEVSRAHQLRRQYRGHIQGALVHAPDLQEAHSALAELCLEEVLEAHVLGDPSGRDALQPQLDAHLQMLPTRQKELLEKRLVDGMGDQVVGQRLRQGTIVGRYAQQAIIAEQMRNGARLVTLLGTAGVGKTRLALELASGTILGKSRIVFCDITEATDELGIARRLARVLDIRLRDTEPFQHLAEELGSEPTALVLDNLEQVRDSVGPMVQAWVRHHKELVVVGTSRVRLGVDDETVVRIQPMTMLEGVELFVRRGHAADRRFELGRKNRHQVCALVQQLDGLPMAIELAAARLNLLSLDEISERLSERFGLLRSRGKEAQALEGALEWSWGLLEPWSQTALAQASLFQGGFTLSAAEGVIRLDAETEAPPMFDVLGELVDSSLLRKIQTEKGGDRYGLLESVRLYASKKLSESGEESSTVIKRRHASHFAQFGSTEFLGSLDGFNGGERWDLLFGDLDNMVAAIHYGTEETAPPCCMAALRALYMKGPISLGVDLASKVLEMPRLSKRNRKLLEIQHSKCLRISGRMNEARAVVGASSRTRSVRQTQVPVGDIGSALDPASETAPVMEPAEAQRLLELGAVAYEGSEAEKATDAFTQALAIFRGLGDPIGEGLALSKLGNVEYAVGNYAMAKDHYSKAILLLRAVGDARTEGSVLGRLGNVLQAEGQMPAAITALTDAIAIHQSVGNKHAEGVDLGNLGNIFRAQGEYQRARELFEESIDIHREVGSVVSEGVAHGNLGEVLFYLGHHAKSVLAFERAISICDEGLPAAAGVFRGSLAMVMAEQGRFQDAFKLIEAAELEVEPVREEYAKLLCKKGEVLVGMNDVSAAREALLRAQEVAGELNQTPESEVAKMIASLNETVASAAVVEESVE